MHKRQIQRDQRPESVNPNKHNPAQWGLERLCRGETEVEGRYSNASDSELSGSGEAAMTGGAEMIRPTTEPVESALLLMPPDSDPAVGLLKVRFFSGDYYHSQAFGHDGGSPSRAPIYTPRFISIAPRYLICKPVKKLRKIWSLQSR